MDHWVLVAFLVSPYDHAYRTPLLEIAYEVDPSPWRDKIRNPQIWANPESRRSFVNEMSPRKLPPAAVGLIHWLAPQDEIDRVLREGLKNNPHDFWLNYIQAGEFSADKTYARAIEFLRAASAIRPHSYFVYLDWGFALSNLKDYEGAIAQNRHALHLNPRAALAHTNLSVIQLDHEHNIEKAIERFKLAIRYNPNDATPYNNWGRALENQGDIKGAFVRFHKAAKVDPNDYGANLNLGRISHQLGTFKDAVKYLKKAVEIIPTAAQARINLGAALAETRKPAKTIEQFKLALKLEPKNAKAHYNWGVLLYKSRDPIKAFNHFQKAVQFDPKHAKAHYNLGVLFGEKSELDGALRHVNSRQNTIPITSEPI